VFSGVCIKCMYVYMFVCVCVCVCIKCMYVCMCEDGDLPYLGTPGVSVCSSGGGECLVVCVSVYMCVCVLLCDCTVFNIVI
jgi:hypothetical protein